MPTDHVVLRGVFENLTVVLFGSVAPESAAPAKPPVPVKKKPPVYVLSLIS